MIVKVNAQKKVNNALQKGKVAVERKLSCPPITVGEVDIKSIDTVKPVDNIIKGVVTDGNKQPIPYATILVKGTKTATSSDTKGEFTLKVNDVTTNKTLVVSSIGFSTKEISVTPKQFQGQTIQLITMKEQLTGEVVVIQSSKKSLSAVE